MFRGVAVWGFRGFRGFGGLVFLAGLDSWARVQGFGLGVVYPEVSCEVRCRLEVISSMLRAIMSSRGANSLQVQGEPNPEALPTLANTCSIQRL